MKPDDILSYSEAHRACQEMERRGGHFASALAKAFYVADEQNSLLIRKAFNYLLRYYLPKKNAANPEV